MLWSEDGPQTPAEAAREFDDGEGLPFCPMCGQPLGEEDQRECPQCGETPASMRAQGWRP